MRETVCVCVFVFVFMRGCGVVRGVPGSKVTYASHGGVAV